MWISSAPLRISLAGGGTDVPGYARRFGGMVLGATIDSRVIVVGRAGRTGRGVRVHLDGGGCGGETANPFAREALARHWDGSPLQLASFADVPGGSGLGSSSAFCVALIAGLLTGRRGGGPLSVPEVAEAASLIEIEALGRPVGRQDQYLSAFGGFHLLRFSGEGGVRVEAVPVDTQFTRRLNQEMLLFFTGTTRDAGDVLQEQNSRVGHSDRGTEHQLHEIRSLVPAALDALKNGDAAGLGEVLGRHWRIKRRLGSRVSTPVVDAAYADALAAGATGGKLLGAGGGGYLLLHAGAAAREQVRAAVASHGFSELPFRFEGDGVRVVELDPVGDCQQAALAQ